MQVVIFGEFAKTYFEKVEEVKMKCDVLYVTDTSFDLKQLNLK